MFEFCVPTSEGGPVRRSAAGGGQQKTTAIKMAKTPPKTTVSSEGLRYHSKVPGSPFVATGHFGAATMSCFLCGKHRPRTQLKSRKLMGKTHFVCAPSCKELEATLSAR